MRTLLSTGTAAARLGVSRERVGQLIRAGILRPVLIDSTGRALLRPADVERLAAEREQAKERVHSRD